MDLMNIIDKLRGKTDHVRVICSWKKFGRMVRSNRRDLLSELGKFDNSILIAGCQRSGTTALSRVMTTSDGMVNYWFGIDDELDAALILAGVVNHSPRGRYCFQTTYLNECYPEYFRNKGKYKLIWMIRNPLSVVHSMLNNWSRFAFNELFDSCGLALASEEVQQNYRKYGKCAIPRVQRACLAYNGKASQLFDLLRNLDNDQILVVDYDFLVENKTKILPEIYDFVGLQYRKEYCEQIRSDSLNKAASLSTVECSVVEQLCNPVYEQLKSGHYAFAGKR